MRRFLMLALPFAVVALANCSSSNPQTRLIPAALSVHGAQAPAAVAADSCAGVPVAVASPGAVYVVPDGASGLTEKCTVDKDLDNHAYVVAYGAERGFLQAALGEPAGIDRNTAQVESNGAPAPGHTDGPLPSPLPTWPSGKPTPTPRPDPTPGPIHVLTQTAEAMVRADGVLRVVDIESASRAGVQADLKRWETNPTEQSMARTPDAQPEATMPPANKVWSLIGSFQQVTDGPKDQVFGGDPLIPTGTFSTTNLIWRLATNDRNYDYIMIGTLMSSLPAYFQGYGHPCYPVCQFWTYQRKQQLWLNYGREILYAPSEDLGPANGIAVDRVSFSVGGNLSGKIGFSDKGATGEGNAGINASYGTSWDQPHATTTSLSTIGSQYGVWQDDTLNFQSSAKFDWDAYKNVVTTAELRNGRVGIFRIPRDTGLPYVLPTIYSTFIVRGTFCICIWSTSATTKEVNIVATAQQPVMLPTFSVDRTTLSLKPKETGTFRIRVRSSPGENAKAWQIVKDPNDNNLTVSPYFGNDADDNSEYQTITVKAQPNAVPGTSYTLYVNTVPAGGAESLRHGSILVTVNID